jgi:dTDP-4-amino-4,6-dideoxygalactose transaminase
MTIPRNKSPIYVTQPFLPPLKEFIPHLEQIWNSKIITNNGPFHQQLEKALCDYLGVKYVSLFANGTIALITALKTLGITGEVITTPYSYVATAHSLLWNHIKPVFVDIAPESLNLDPTKIEASISDKTTAILPVHCYGRPCDVLAIQKIADRYKLKIIYDSAHAFGVRDKEGSILRHGDLSVLSFHATKVFNTFEGGAIICHDEKTKQDIDRLKNFGFNDEITVVSAGINGKMSEFNAALGILQLKYVDTVIALRKKIDLTYRAKLSNIRGISCLKYPQGLDFNYTYFPIFVEADYPISRDELYYKLKEENIYSRRYFYPLISDFNMYKEIPSEKKAQIPTATSACQQVLCLPIYPDLSIEQINLITKVIAR